MHTRFISKISGVVAAFALLSLALVPTATHAAGISIIDQRCVDDDGVVEVQFPSNIESFKLSGPDTDQQDTNANFKTFSDLSDGNYTLTAYTTSGGATATFSVDCDEDTEPEPDDPEVSITDQRCVAGDGVVEASFANITRFKLSGPNTDNQNSTANFKTFSDLADGNYTLKVWNSVNASNQTSFTVDCDPETKQKATLKVFSEGIAGVPIHHVHEWLLGDGANTNYTRTYNQKIEETWVQAPSTYSGHELVRWEGCDRTGDGGRSCYIESIDLGETRSLTVIYEKADEPETCDPNPEADLEATAFDANQGSVTIKNSSDNCSYKVGIASYKGFAINQNNPNQLVINSQKLFDDKTIQLQAGKSVTLDIDVPSCAYQIDAFYGDVITSFADGTRYGDRLLAAAHKNVNNLCGEDEEGGPKIQLEAKACVADEGQGANGFGSATFNTSTGLDSYKLINTSTGNTVVNDTNGAGKGSISFSDLPNGNYRLEGKLNGKTKSVAFTIDCGSDGPGLSGICSVSDSNVGLGDNVTFSANASGGQSPYSYSWDLEGSDDDADTKNITTEYKQTGTYDGTVTITDDAGDEITRTCSVTVKVNDDDDDGGGGGDRLDPRGKKRVRGDRDVNFGVQCLPEKSVYNVGEVVLFEATIDNDDIDIDDVDFDWSGATNIDEDDEKATVQFRTGGIKEIRISAEYDGDTETDTCYVQIGRGVSLDEVPYTGPGEIAKTLAFITTILLLALGAGYAIIKRREDEGIPVGIPNKHSN